MFKTRFISMLVLLAAVATGAVAQTNYKVSVKEGTEDATNWTITPAEATTTGVAAGTEVKATYGGTKRVKSVKAKKMAPAVAEGHALSASVVGDIVGTDGKAYAAADKDNLPTGVTAVAMVAYKSATAGSSLAIALANEGSRDWNSAKSTCAGKAKIDGHSWKLPSQAEWKQMFSAFGGNENSYTGLNNALSAAGGASSTLQNGFYWSSSEVNGDTAWNVRLVNGGTEWFNFAENKEDANNVRACLAF